jgi:PTS system mannose-specific IIC component
MMREVLLTGAVGGLLWLDRFQIFQVMISRPIVAAPLVGWIVGDLNSGLASGLIFEMLWLRRPPLGGFIGPDVTLASIAVSSVSAAVRSETGVDLLPVVLMSFLLLFPVSFLGTRLDVLLRKYVGRIATHAEKIQAEGADRAVFIYFGSALALGYCFAFLFLVTITLGGALILTWIVPLIPPPVIRATGTAFYLVPLLGALDLFVGLEQRPHAVLFIIGFLVALGTSLVLCFLS